MRFRMDQRGQSLVELAFILPVLLLIVTGLFDLARAVWQENTLAYAAREGSRYAIVHGSASSSPSGPNSTSDSSIASVVRNAAIGVPNITVDTAWYDATGSAASPCNDRNCQVSVDATAPFVPLPSQYLLNGAFSVTLRGGSRLVIER